MGFKDIIQKMIGRKDENDPSVKEYIKELDRKTRAEKIVNERMLSANERELLRLHNEDREESIKQQLEQARNKKRKDVHFGHNALNTKNVIYSDYNILQDKQLFRSEGNMFSSQKNIFSPQNQVKPKRR